MKTSEVTVILSPESVKALILGLQKGEPTKLVGGDSDNYALWLNVVPQKGAMYSRKPYKGLE